MTDPRLPRHGVLIALLLACAACQSRDPQNIEPVYDKLTGKLQLLKYDANGNQKVDTWSYMDGARVLRIEIDRDEDGHLDRWEYYDAAQKLERIGTSRANDGREDAWLYPGPDGIVMRIDISAKRDGKVTRTEFFENEALVRAHEDSNDDGRVDKWETYDGERLAIVAFDTIDRGTADRRLIYAVDGSVRLEVDAAGDGQFVAVSKP